MSHQLSHYEDDLCLCCVVDYIYTVGLGVTSSVFRILLFDNVGWHKVFGQQMQFEQQEVGMLENALLVCVVYGINI